MLDLAAQLLDRHLGNRVCGANPASMPQTASGALHDFVGDADELAISSPLMPPSLRRCHPLDRLHTPARRESAIAKTLDWPRDCAR